jgi:predicted transcriptional regulator
MAQLQDLLSTLLKTRNISARTFAERTGIAYPTLLGVLNKGTVPRKAEHREVLRKELGLELGAWAVVVAASQRDALDIPEDGPLTLQQLVTKALLSQGHTEQTFSKSHNIPYPTLMGITRKGSVPRADTLVRLAELLALAPAEVQAAAALSRAGRGSDEALDLPDPGNDGEHLPGDIVAPSLSQLAAEAVALAGGSMASWARAHRVPYLSLVRLISVGDPPRRSEVLEPLRAALGLGDPAFAASLERSRSHPEPAHLAKHNDQPVTPLQAALQAAVQERSLTLKSFSELVDLSPLTAAKLLKAGELPGRATTHEKLRAFLNLDADDYHSLLNRSRTPGTGTFTYPGVPPTPSDPAVEAETDEHVPTSITGFHDALSDEDLVRMVRSLKPGQRTAVVQLLRSFR